MANDIYKYIETGLTSLMSARAARRMLHGALRAKGYRPHSLTAGQMHSALEPLGQDLKRLLPGEAVDRHLQVLSRQLERRFGQSKAGDAPTVEAQSVEAQSVEETSAAPTSGSYRPAPPVPDPLVPEAASLEGSPPHTVSLEAILPDVISPAVMLPEPEPESPEPESPGEPEPAPAPVRDIAAASSAEWSPEALERAVLAFAQLDGVRMVALISARGALQSARGSGFELSALSRLGSLGLKLLSRSGSLRSFYLAQERGHLFLFPLGTALLMVIGHPEVNLGRVFATFSTLKEDV